MEKVGTDAYSLDVNGHCALLTSGRLILIDTGTEPSAESLLKDIEACGYKPSDIEHIIITHMHGDHVGGLATIQQVTEARIASHEIEAKYITKESEYQWTPIKGKLSHQAVAAVDDVLTDGQTYQGLLVIHTPGHTPGHIALLDEDSGLLIAGDSLRTDNDSVFSMPDQYNYNPEEHRKSMKKLLDYKFNSMIVGHGHPIHSDAHAKVKNATK